MGLAKIKTSISVEEYLDGERDSPVRHEYVDGQVYAMAGGSDRHNRLSLNLASRLNDHLVDSECEAFINDMKIKVGEVLYYYPDVVVACDETPTDRYTREHPVLVVEVIPPSTERTDRQEKLIAYKRVPSMREYILASQDRMLIEIHRRIGDSDEWTREILINPDDLLRLESVKLNLQLKDVYRNVRFDDLQVDG